MAQVLVRNLDAKTLDSLKRRAKRNNRSLQQELKTILEEASGLVVVDRFARADAIYERLKRSGKRFSDSAALIRRDRSR
jgi:plasmid stability protein